MALLSAGGCAGLALKTTNAQVRQKSATFATLSPPSERVVVNWVEATNSFFEKDSRPIMLYDGNSCIKNQSFSYITKVLVLSNIRLLVLLAWYLLNCR